ncbi:MAG: hypothetical protein HYY78_11580 [Betaproteobacteria bacterium]|nr:hypothetical protein [Betaproteobacteria bacterium]
MMRSRAILIAACVVPLAGCTALRGIETQEPAPWVQAGSPRPASEADDLLLYYRHVRRLSGAELAREHETARQAYARARSDYNRIRFAMVLALPNTGFSDEGRAQELLEPVSKNPSGSLHGLAYLLGSQLQERRRLDASAQGLQQKLDALKSLERSLIERKR